MRIVYNSLIPWRGYLAVNLLGIVFIRRELKDRVGVDTINHERIHTEQMKEMGYIGFYIWYALEWLIRLAINGKAHEAYRQVSLEREAYRNECDMDYCKTRKHYNWIHYVGKID